MKSSYYLKIQIIILLLLLISPGFVLAAYSEQEQIYVDAVNSQDITKCNELIGNDDQQYSQDNCLYTIAIALADENICQQINNQVQVGLCSKVITKDKAINSNDLNKCYEITDEIIKNQCFAYFIEQNNDLNYCNNFSDQQLNQYCQDLINKRLAIKNKDRTLCENIKDESQKSDCQISLKNVTFDTDHDGLDDDYEMLYGLNLFVADSDGDGLTDSDELLIYKTDPRKLDSDGNGIPDGDQALYKPLPPPTETGPALDLKIILIYIIIIAAVLIIILAGVLAVIKKSKKKDPPVPPVKPADSGNGLI